MNRKPRTLGALVALALSASLVGCGSMNDQQKSTAVGAAIGGVAGRC